MGFVFVFVCLFVFVSLDRDGVWLSYRTGKVGGSILVPPGLEARPPLSLTVHFLLSHGMRICSFSVEIPLFEAPGLGFAPIW